MSIDAGHPGISWVLQFRARIDGSLLRLRSPEGTGWDLFIRAGALFLEGTTSSMSLALDMEDTAYLTDGTWHSLAITATAAGSKIFLDGYNKNYCFSDKDPDLASHYIDPLYSSTVIASSKRFKEFIRQKKLKQVSTYIER